MKRRQRLLSNQADDRGAALLLVLIVVTVVALSGAAMLSFSDTSLRTTVALRDQGAGAYAADGAAQVAISELQNGSFPNNCATLAGDGLPLGSGTKPFYQSAQSSFTALNAYVSCVPDPSYSLMYLSVWVCPAAASSCDRSSGPARLTAKVQVAPPAPVKVLSWSVQR
jgi:hypothetical protein